MEKVRKNILNILKESEEFDEEEQPKTDKQREIEEAWREYYEQQYS